MESDGRRKGKGLGERANRSPGARQERVFHNPKGARSARISESLKKEGEYMKRVKKVEGGGVETN